MGHRCQEKHFQMLQLIYCILIFILGDIIVRYFMSIVGHNIILCLL